MFYAWVINFDYLTTAVPNAQTRRVLDYFWRVMPERRYWRAYNQHLAYQSRDTYEWPRYAE